MKNEEWKLFGKLKFEKLFTRQSLGKLFSKSGDEEIEDDDTWPKGGHAKVDMQ